MIYDVTGWLTGSVAVISHSHRSCSITATIANDALRAYIRQSQRYRAYPMLSTGYLARGRPMPVHSHYRHFSETSNCTCTRDRPAGGNCWISAAALFRRCLPRPVSRTLTLLLRDGHPSRSCLWVLWRGARFTSRQLIQYWPHAIYNSRHDDPIARDDPLCRSTTCPLQWRH